MSIENENDYQILERTGNYGKKESSIQSFWVEMTILNREMTILNPDYRSILTRYSVVPSSNFLVSVRWKPWAS